MTTTPPLGFSHGSFSTFHMSASKSDIRRWKVTPRTGSSAITPR
jgi:hypothetical protein